MPSTDQTHVPDVCASCGSGLAAGLLACLSCHQLVHTEALQRLRQEAEAAAARADCGAELSAWRQAAVLLPPGSRQHAAVAERIEQLSRRVTHQTLSEGPPATGRWKWLSGLGAFGALIWKAKFLVVALLTKGKFLFLGLTKASTLLSMLLAFGVYWTAWGLWFAGGLVLSIYIHEMGHVAALRRYGIAASAPMFVPGLGAYIRLQAARLAPHEDARIGLAGPLWGLIAALLTFAAARIGGAVFAAIAHTAAWINLFNLLPVWQLDGSRGFAALNRPQRWLVVATFALAWWVSDDGLLLLLTIVGGFRALQADAPDRPDSGVAVEFVALILALAAIVRFSEPFARAGI